MPYRIRLKPPAGRLNPQPDRLVLDNSGRPGTPSREWQPIRATEHAARRLAPLAFPGQVLLGLAEQTPHHAPARRPAHTPQARTQAQTQTPTNTAAAALALHNAFTARLLRDLAGTARRLGNLLTGGKGLRILHGGHRRLQVTETVQLGEKRFVAIVRVDGEQFLIGGSATGVSLLSNLQPAQPALSTEAPTAPPQPSFEPDPASFEAVLAAHHSAEGAA